MGTSLTKIDSECRCDSLLGSPASSQQQDKNMDVMLQWRAWMAKAEGLYLQGKLKACREALTNDTIKPSLPEGTLEAALLRVTARANVSICKLAEMSLREDRAGRGGGGKGEAGRSRASTGDAAAESRQEAVEDLEDAMREAIAIASSAAAAAAATARVSSSNSSPPTAAANKLGKNMRQSYPDAPPDSKSNSSIITGGISKLSSKGNPAGNVDPMLPEKVIEPSSSPLRYAVMASAAEDVAIQVACSLLSSRLTWGEASKALSSALFLLTSRRSNITSAAAENPKEAGSGRGEREGREEKKDVDVAAVAAADAFFGVDLLREAFESALTSEDGERRRRLPLPEAAPRLVHLLRLTWLLATANLALGRNPARIIAVAEHAYSARRSAWRKATLILSSSLPGASGVPLLPPPLHVPSDQLPTFGEVPFRAEYGIVGVDGGIGKGRDPALAMCRYLRGLSLLGCGDRKAAREQLEACIELDPRCRHAFVCLAHLLCHASADASTVTKPGTRNIHPRSRWKPDGDECTQEILRVLAQGYYALSDARERRMKSPRGGGTAEGVLEKGEPQGGQWRAFEEERGGGVEAWLLLACAARAGGDYGGAVSRFRRALAIDSSCLEAVYGIARVFQESGNDPAGCRNLLLFVGERSQKLSSAAAASTSIPTSDASSSGGHRSPTSAVGDLGDRRREAARLCFPLCGEASKSNVGFESVVGNLMLPAELTEVMWRVARAAMDARDWASAILALRGLEADRMGAGDLRGRVYFASYPGVLDTQSAAAGRASPGPGLARVLRALAYCQLRRGLFREALETSEAVLREGDGCNTGGGDAAMLMFRADALLCLEEGEDIAMDSLDKATRLLDLRQIDISSRSSLYSAENKAGVVTTCGSESDKELLKLRGGVGASVSRGRYDSSPVDNASDDDCSAAERHQRHQRIARTVAYNNRAVLLIAAGRCAEACRLLRACLSLLPGEPRPAFNLALALWRLGRPREACSQWLESRGWLKAGGSGDGVDVDRFSRLLEASRRRKALLESDKEKRRTAGFDRVSGTSSHVVDSIGDHLTVPPIQLCLLDIRSLSWWLDNLNVVHDKGLSVSTADSSGDSSAYGSGSGSGGLLRSILTSR